MKVPPEKLGSFYLGSKYDLEKDEVTGEIVNYDARDLINFDRFGKSHYLG